MTTQDTPGPKTVLVLEDDVLLALDLALLVEESGARVLGPFHRAEDARASVDAELPDLAVLDFNLGNHTSQDFAGFLAESGVPFAFLTGHSAQYLGDAMKSAEILEKPISPGKLTDFLRRGGRSD